MYIAVLKNWLYVFYATVCLYKVILVCYNSTESSNLLRLAKIYISTDKPVDTMDTLWHMLYCTFAQKLSNFT